jgi:hypothetical protein
LTFDIGGRQSKDVLEVVTVIDGGLGSINVKQMLGCSIVIMEPLEEGTTETVDLGLGNGLLRGIDAEGAAISHGVELA